LRTNWFIVVEARGGWWVDNEGSSFGPFVSKQQAGIEARVIAQAFGDPRRVSRIYAPDEAGRPSLIWESAAGGE